MAIAIVCAFVLPAFARALPVSHYAASSRLASGKWVRVRVDKTGVQLITDAQLKNLGFSDPSKVNVYGYGGQLISEILDANQKDDLPPVPVMRTERGLMFFGVNSLKWTPTTSSQTSEGKYWHEIHAYQDVSYYFLSDVPLEQAPALTELPAGEISGEPATTFTERLLHEQELTYPTVGFSGRQALGEDFRAQSVRSFPFALPGNTGADVDVTVRYVTRSSGGGCTFTPSFNGKSDKACQVAAIRNNDVYATGQKMKYKVHGAGENLDMRISFTSSGVLYFANLDFIEVEYERELRLTDDQLYFYMTRSSSTGVEVAGCGPATQIWDVTTPGNPQIVKFTLEGDKARFAKSGTGYREYVAFNPEKLSTQPAGAGAVANQDIHSLPVPDMLIITPAVFKAQAERVADMRRRVDKMVVHVLTPEELYNEFSSGTRDVSAFRKALKMWYDRGEEDGHSIRYCLIFGRPTYDNKMISASIKNGVERVPIWQAPPLNDFWTWFGAPYGDSTSETHSNSFSTDDFIGMLDDTNASNYDMESAKIHVSVGRMPVKSAEEAKVVVDKLTKYVEEPDFGSWRNNVLLIADDQDQSVHVNQTQKIYNGIVADEVGDSYEIERLYFDNYPMVPTSTGMTYPGPKARFMEKLSEGVMLVSYVGHGAPTSLSHENFMTWNDLKSLSHKRLPFFFTFTCEFGPWEEEAVTAAEEVWLNPNSGFIGLISTSRTVLIRNNGNLTEVMAKGMLGREADGTRRRLGDIYRLGKNYIRDDNKLRFTIVGDPALQLPGPAGDVVVDSIGDVRIADQAADAPQLKALSKTKVSGHIARLDGSVDTDFNGVVELVLYDAEKVITTRGNGDNDSLITYNDRVSRLFKGTARVDSGYWSTEVMVPLEIENNYSPARITLYGYSDKGVEVNGHTDRLYVYGFDEDIADDTQGPDISRFTLNSDGFRDGGAVNSTPLVLADFSDPSGINISNIGIGHTMTLTLDGKTHLTDVATYYTPTPDDPTSGSVSYLMPQIDPGQHTLDFTVWDNAGNSSTRSISFTVGAHASTVIYGLTTDRNPATTSVTFSLTAEQPEPGTECRLDVYDLSGRKVWTYATNINSAADANINVTWNLQDGAGRRVPRGIYLYRATLSNSSGNVDSVTKKLAVAAGS